MGWHLAWTVQSVSLQLTVPVPKAFFLEQNERQAYDLGLLAYLPGLFFRQELLYCVELLWPVRPAYVPRRSEAVSVDEAMPLQPLDSMPLQPPDVRLLQPPDTVLLQPPDAAQIHYFRQKTCERRHVRLLSERHV